MSGEDLFAAAFPPSEPRKQGFRRVEEGAVGKTYVLNCVSALEPASGGTLTVNPATAHAIVNVLVDICGANAEVEAREFAAIVSLQFHARLAGSDNAERLKEVVQILKGAHDEAFADFVQEGDMPLRIQKYEHIARACGYVISPALPPEVVDLT